MQYRTPDIAEASDIGMSLYRQSQEAPNAWRTHICSLFKHRTKQLLAPQNVANRLGKSTTIAADTSLITECAALKNALLRLT